MTEEDLRSRQARLQRLRAAMPRRFLRFEHTPVELAAPAPLGPTPRGVSAMLPGVEVETALGACYLLREHFAREHRHGGEALGALAERTLAPAARLAREPRLADLTAADCAFLDTETTGLSLGAGTLVFLVGVGLLAEDGGVEVQQYFLRDPGEEPAMLAALEETLSSKAALVTFNGRGFDVPMLAGRYLLNRMRPRLESMPNLDLLPPARRLWRRRIRSCALSNLEREVLGVRRTAQDVPGWLIPQLYQDYLRTGDATEMTRVVYHNLMDVLSMVTLTSQMCRAFEAVDEATPALPPQDQLSLARWYAALNMLGEAEAAYRAALDADLPDDDLRCVYRDLAALLRRTGRRAEAVEQWAMWSVRIPNDPEPCVEIAKHLEWRAGDITGAHRWAAAALEAADRLPPGLGREAARADIRHRLARLARKMGRR